MTPLDVGNRLVELYRAERYLAPVDELFADEVVSHEPVASGGIRSLHGRLAVRGSHADWLASFRIHDAMIEGPYPHGDDRFAVRMKFEVTESDTGEQRTLDEVTVYEVREGKIVVEEFFYEPG